jgi:hypothetical protein
MGIVYLRKSSNYLLNQKIIHLSKHAMQGPVEEDPSLSLKQSDHENKLFTSQVLIESFPLNKAVFLFIYCRKQNT